jgi:hypothetical protein
MDPLKGRPHDHDEEQHLMRVSGYVSEFENRTGKRYRCVIENGKKVHIPDESTYEKSHASTGENLLQEAPGIIWHFC